MSNPNIVTIPVTDIDSWLQNRLLDVTSTEVSALYDLSPYKTEYELYHEKKNGEIVRIEENERMTWGKRLEASIANGAAETMGWDIDKLDVYIRNPETRLGSSFDYQINSSSDGTGILEVKNVDGAVYRRNWNDDGAGNIEAPEHIELQIQHQMEVADVSWCAIVALVGGNTQKVIFRNRDREIGKDLVKKVGAFWAKVDAGTPPSADYEKDAEFIIKTLRNQAEAGLVAQADPDLDELIKGYAFASQEASSMAKVKDSYKAQILERVGEASKVLSGLGTISCGMSKPSEGTLVTQDMVGTYLNPRKGYRMFRFTKNKGDK